jgi:L-amino acid N-acyltransferase YncA
MKRDISIRQAKIADAEAILTIYGPICEASPTSFETRSPTLEEMEDRIRKITAFYPWLVAENDGKILGYAYAGQHRERAAYRWAIDVAVYIHADSRRTGIGTAVYCALFELIKAQGFCRAYAGITVPNPGSIRIHQQMGFVPIGTYHEVGFKLGAWHDVLWMGAVLRSAINEPKEPVGIGTIDPQTWEIALRKGLAQLAKTDHHGSLNMTPDMERQL